MAQEEREGGEVSRAKVPRYLYAEKGCYIIFAKKRSTAKIVRNVHYTKYYTKNRRAHLRRYTTPRCCPGCGSVVMVGNAEKTEAFYVQKDVVVDTMLNRSGCVDCMSEQNPDVGPELILFKLNEKEQPQGHLYSGMAGMTKKLAVAMYPILNCAPLDAYADRRKRDDSIAKSKASGRTGRQDGEDCGENAEEDG